MPLIAKTEKITVVLIADGSKFVSLLSQQIRESLSNELCTRRLMKQIEKTKIIHVCDLILITVVFYIFFINLVFLKISINLFIEFFHMIKYNIENNVIYLYYIH